MTDEPRILSRVHDPSCAALEKDLRDRLAERERRITHLAEELRAVNEQRNQLGKLLAAAEAREEEWVRAYNALAQRVVAGGEA